jgi:5-methyltetrahydropteroyltriglutamate--homocysteine methyltransferase
MTTHVTAAFTPPQNGVYCRLIGSLPKTEPLRALLYDQIEGRPYDAGRLEALILETMGENIRRQVALGYPLVVSGEPERESFFHHIYRTLTGFERVSAQEGWFPADLQDFPEVAHLVFTEGWLRLPQYRCVGQIAELDPDAIHGELELYKRALGAVGWPVGRAIVTEPAPGNLLVGFEHSPYKSRQAFIAALTPIMKKRYQAVIDAGFILSVDVPQLLIRHATPMTLEQFVDDARMQVTSLNEALAGLPLERVHAHGCYGNYRGPDTRDEALQNVIGPLLNMRVGTLFLEGALSRHREDYLVLKASLDGAAAVPDTMGFGVGVIDTKYFSVEDAEEVASRIVLMRRALGNRLAACSPDCGYETMTGIPNIPPSVVWAKNELLPRAVAIANSVIERMEAPADRALVTGR